MDMLKRLTMRVIAKTFSSDLLLHNRKIMFRSLQTSSGQNVTIHVEGAAVTVPEGISVAAAILGHSQHASCRCSFVSGENRSPFCFIGVCHECLVEINGKPNQQACLIQVCDGMVVKKQCIREGA